MKAITKTTYFALFTVACFAVAPALRAVTPAPDGGYPGGNTAEGNDALFNLTTGTDNVAVGFQALFSNNTGSHNIAVGNNALFNNSEGVDNVAVGTAALQTNRTGDANTAMGEKALFSNAIGTSNTATGSQALFNNINGHSNTAVGAATLYSNTTASANTAVGIGALEASTTGGHNIAVGALAGNNITIGFNNIEIGNRGTSADFGTIRIGTVGTQTNAFIAGISGVTVANGVSVVVNSNGRLGTVTSSARFKDEIKPMDKASEAILALTPVTFHYKRELDPERIPQFGLVAEEVAKVNPDLVARDEQGKPYTVRYEAVNAMLLNEFLKEHRKVEEQGRELHEQKAINAELRSTIVQQNKSMEALVEQVRAQNARIEKVSAQVATQLARPQVAEK